LHAPAVPEAAGASSTSAAGTAGAAAAAGAAGSSVAAVAALASSCWLFVLRWVLSIERNETNESATIASAFSMIEKQQKTRGRQGQALRGGTTGTRREGPFKVF